MSGVDIMRSAMGASLPFLKNEMEPIDIGLPKPTYLYMKGVRRPNMNKYSRPHQGKNVRYITTDHGITRIKL